MENDIIEFDLKGFLSTDRFCITPKQCLKTIRIKLDNYTLIIYGYLSSIQLPILSTNHISYNSDYYFNDYSESLSDLELKFFVDHYVIEDVNGKETNDVNPESIRIINQILKSIT